MKRNFIIFLFLYLVSTRIFGDNPHIITLFLKKYPAIEKYDIDHAQQKLKNQQKLANSTIKHTTQNWTEGIFCSYAGYLAISNYLNQITFPRKHQKEKFYILVTPKINPIFMFPNTIHHLEINDQSPSDFYSLEKIHDKQTNMYMWKTEKKDIPKNKRIPLNTIIFFSNPKHIYVPTGVVLTNNNAQLVLPDIYVKKTFNHAANSLFVSNIKQFFGNVQTTENAKGLVIQTITTG